ncbi:aKG-HExxH-type peptide beta-hydroxylase [Histidinibacterium lentulum]|uniref:HEXXH motif domain-containing protein n=1 Tax=Histidinibacterium lentulum TaxID=2480588 RepID=A0A3N2QV27_9RHOB|nr:HEXXH motif-containing putative peptide modification protein [Histidinibacterium lentulum]ROT99083.1 HEXXH motif domain-containing protein [Histidinibacterium lentulum]
MTDSDLLVFAPSGARATRLDDRMHDELASSLGHVAEAAAELPDLCGPLKRAVHRIEAGDRLPPEAFGAYYELVERATTGDIDRAAEIAEVIAAIDRRPAGMPVLARGSEEAARIDHCFDTRMGDGAGSFAPITEEMRAEFAGRLTRGLDLLERGTPDLHAEIRQLVRVVLLAQAPEGATMQFDGASHYQFWGLLLLNPTFHKTPVAVAEVLAHEAGHSLLFGLTIHEPLTLNPDEERFKSPLRADPRPMDGIYHATFVSARMAWAMERLAASGVLTPEERIAAEEAAAADRRNFAAGDAVIRESGQLSETGLRIIENARAFMAEPAIL